MANQKMFVPQRNFLVKKDGVCRNMNTSETILLKEFGEDKENVYSLNLLVKNIRRLIQSTSDDIERIKIATILIKRFLSQADADWIVDSCPPPDPKKRVSINKLHSEHDDSFHISTFSCLPQGSNVHCHGTWSVVAILGDSTTGRELNYFWSRQDDGSKPKQNYAVVKPISKQILEPGDIIGFTSNAIHNIKSISAVNSDNTEQSIPTLAFILFGRFDSTKQYVFNPFDNTCSRY